MTHAPRLANFLQRLIAALLLLTMLPLNAAAQASALAEFFACLERKSASIVSAHRGGPAAGYPENALETLVRGAEHGLRLFEVDVSSARDGVLFLMHDRSLDRTTTGSGAVAQADWADIAALRLMDRDGLVTPYAPPTLRAVLRWAAENAVFLTLDIKGETDIERLAAEVAAAGMADRVIYIAATEEAAHRLLELSPGAMVSVPPESLDSGAIPPGRALLWTGFRDFDVARIARLDAAGLYVNFGTLGFGDSLDDRIAASGDDSGYLVFQQAGLHVISSDRPLAVRRSLHDAGSAWDNDPACLR